MPRDKLAEIAAMRGRGRSEPWRGKDAIAQLHRDLDSGRSYPPGYIVIRLVTALEVFTRDWVKELVDAGEPYIGRAAEFLKGTLKIDFAAAQGLVGKQVTFGDLVAHEIAVSGVGDIDRIFNALLQLSIFDRLQTVVDRWEVEIGGKPPVPLMPCADETKATMARLFETRHIHVHELPAEPEVDPALLADFVAAALSYSSALDEFLWTELRGDYPLTQLEMNARAGEKADEADLELDAVLHRLDPEGALDGLKRSQAAWELYREEQSEFRSGSRSPSRGSMAPMIHASERERITRARVAELEWYLNRADGEMRLHNTT